MCLAGRYATEHTWINRDRWYNVSARVKSAKMELGGSHVWPVVRCMERTAESFSLFPGKLWQIQIPFLIHLFYLHCIGPWGQSVCFSSTSVQQTHKTYLQHLLPKHFQDGVKEEQLKQNNNNKKMAKTDTYCNVGEVQLFLFKCCQ